MIQTSTRNSVDAVREIGHAVRDINEVTSNIASAVGRQDAATRKISANAQSAAQTLVANIAALSSAIGETRKAATSLHSASSDLTPTAEILSSEVEKFFQNLRTDPHDRHGDGARRTGAAAR